MIERAQTTHRPVSAGLAASVVLAASLLAGLASAAPTPEVTHATLATQLLVAQKSFRAVPPPEDPCRPDTIPIGGWQPQIDHLDVRGGGVDLYRIKTAPSPIEGSKVRPLVVIVNGNGFDLSDYEQLATHLASKGFLVAVAERPAAGSDASWVLGVAWKILEQEGLSSTTPVALVGHSKGGEIVTQSAILNVQSAGLAIGAVVGIAPTANPSNPILTADHVPASLTIYGSQDQDVDGLTASPSDSFSAYEKAGTESSTTCTPGGICTLKAGLDKTMVYLHGATHHGLLNTLNACFIGGACTNDYVQYVSPSDQFCVTKTYTEAFLRWTLADDDSYKKLVRDRYRTPSLVDMETSAADAMGNPAGSPITLRVQSSPRLRSVINNFEGGALNLDPAGFGVFTQLMEGDDFIGGPANVRHITRGMLVGWETDPTWQLLALWVPPPQRDSTSYTHLALRIGQFDDLTGATTANAANQAQSVLVGIDDGSYTSWRWLDPVPANDRRPSGKPHGALTTFEIPLSQFTGKTDKANVEAIYLAFPGGTQGTLMIDSVEWFRD